MNILKIIRGLWSPQINDHEINLEIKEYPIIRPYSTPSNGRRQIPIPDSIGRFYIPLSVLESTNRVMRRFAAEERECYVWWGGYFKQNGDGQIVTAIHPEIKTNYGQIHLEEAVLRQLHSQLRKLDQVLLIELHTHPPGAGGQNDVDAAHAAAPYKGFITIVVPDFAYPNLYDLRKTYVYEYIAKNKWQMLSPDEIKNRFIIEESLITVVPNDKSNR